MPRNYEKEYPQERKNLSNKISTATADITNCLEINKKVLTKKELSEIEKLTDKLVKFAYRITPVDKQEILGGGS